MVACQPILDELPSVSDSSDARRGAKGRRVLDTLEKLRTVGYLDDSTVVVVEHASDSIGAVATVEATSILTTGNGRTVFAELGEKSPTREHGPAK